MKRRQNQLFFLNFKPKSLIPLLAIPFVLGCEFFDDKESRAANTEGPEINLEVSNEENPEAPTNEPTKEVSRDNKLHSQEELRGYCYNGLKDLPAGLKGKELEKLKEVCASSLQLPGCISEGGQPIFHYDKISDYKKGKRILAMALIHGDETPSGTVARAWMMRLHDINPRNSWRVIPINNPDGLDARTRMNGRGVDLNRNFPTAGWENEALKLWKTKKKSDPRRYPGPSPASEIETVCNIKHFEDFKPDFIISIHTPLGMLDFDGPKRNIRLPKFSPLPWISLGHFPGSLGRYMWRDHNVPVLTIELKGNSGIRRLEKFDRLQDITGTVAIQSDKVIKKKKKKSTN